MDLEQQLSEIKSMLDSYCIKESSIHGRGVFSTNTINNNTRMLATIDGYENCYYTDLARYINHSETPNCKVHMEGQIAIITTSYEIQIDTELTVNYLNNPDTFSKEINPDIKSLKYIFNVTNIKHAHRDIKYKLERIKNN